METSKTQTTNWAGKLRDEPLSVYVSRDNQLTVLDIPFLFAFPRLIPVLVPPDYTLIDPTL